MADNSTYDFGEIKKMAVREIWADEAKNFTPWLAKNIDALGSALGLKLKIEEREASVGNFRLDLLAVNSNTQEQEKVVIENQFGTTNHDHLGKLITYASGYEASIVILVAESIRIEHRQALNWLNQKTDAKTQFFAIEVEVFKIDNSKPTYRFQPVVTPNEWQKSKAGSTITPRGMAYQSYFQALIDRLREEGFTNATQGQTDNWYSFSSGVAGISYVAIFAWGKFPIVAVYIEQQDKYATEEIFDALEDEKSAIEQKYGTEFEWNRNDGKQHSRIHLVWDNEMRVTSMSETERDELLKWHFDNLLKMKEVFGPYIEQFKK